MSCRAACSTLTCGGHGEQRGERGPIDARQRIDQGARWPSSATCTNASSA